MSPVRSHSPWNTSRLVAVRHQYPVAIESPRTSRWPGSSSATGAPAASTSRASYPGTTVPEVPGRTAPGRLEMKMCSASVEPRPSMMSTPYRVVKRR